MASSTQADLGRSTTVIEEVLKGGQHVVSHPGSSQYGGGSGASSCGLACLNFARILFAKEESLRGEEVLTTIIDRSTAMEVTAIGAEWTSNTHLEVEDILQVPLFEKSLKLVSTKYFQPGVKRFLRLLKDMQAISTSCVAVITRPPEIIACLKFVIDSQPVFVIYDSHSRPNHPDGAGFILSTSPCDTAAALSDILPVDNRLLSYSDLQWQAQLLANCSAHTFISRGLLSTSADLTEAVVQSSLTILALRAELNTLKSQQSELAADNKRLATEMELMEDRHEEERRRLLSANSSHRHDSARSPASSTWRYSANTPSTSPNQGRPNMSWISSSATRHPQAVHNNHGFLDHRAAQQQPGGSLTDLERSAEAAAERQRQYDEEDRSLRLQREELAKFAQRSFNCGVCFDEQPEDVVTRLAPCGHTFCRECIRNHISTKIAEHRYPVLCPVCMANQGSADPSIVTRELLEQIGVTEAEFETWMEMEMVQFSVLLHCRKCQRSVFVDKQDLEDTRTLACPLPDCNYIWCKLCQQSIALDSPQHSCDGTSELDDLMKKKGWKYCPGCKTPIQKETGCNHMTCTSPGCNTHFCYLCGESIIQSALKNDVGIAVSTHYRRCRMFEY